MDYLSVKEWAGLHGIPERTARNYCAQGRIAGAYLTGKTWNIPADAEVPARGQRRGATPLLRVLREQMAGRVKGGVYHCIQIEFTYNSNHMEGSRLTHDQTRYIFETNTIGVVGEAVNVDDIIETANHFRAVDHIISETEGRLTEAYIKNLHRILKSGTSDERRPWFRIGGYKLLPNEVGGRDTAAPEAVGAEMRALLSEYNGKGRARLEDIIDFHQRLEAIHPFQDGNGRVGRLVMFRECLRHGHVPFIISDDLKMYYYNGLRHWPAIKGYLMDTCLTAQDRMKRTLDRFRVPYREDPTGGQAAAGGGNFLGI